MRQRLIHYTGRHLGPAPFTPLPGGAGRITWDEPVKAVPAGLARHLLGGRSFVEALPVDEAAVRFGLTASAVAQLVETRTYAPPDGEPVEVVTLDPRTVAKLRKAQKPAKAPRRGSRRSP